MRKISEKFRVLEKLYEKWNECHVETEVLVVNDCVTFLWLSFFQGVPGEYLCFKWTLLSLGIGQMNPNLGWLDSFDILAIGKLYVDFGKENSRIEANRPPIVNRLKKGNHSKVQKHKCCYKNADLRKYWNLRPKSLTWSHLLCERSATFVYNYCMHAHRWFHDRARELSVQRLHYLKSRVCGIELNVSHALKVLAYHTQRVEPYCS